MSRILNRKANFEYDISKRFTAGLVLQGTEIKSVVLGHVDLTSAYVMIPNKNEAWAHGVSIRPIETTWFKPTPNRPIRLLLNKHEIAKLLGNTIIVTKLFIQNGKAKIEIGIAKKRKLFDKRAKERDKSDELSRRRGLDPEYI